MQALVKTQKGVGHLEIRDVPVPAPGPGEVLIKVHSAGICGTDLHILKDEFPYIPPVTLGHEFSGEVVALGPQTNNYHEGDRIVAEPHRGGCGTCRYCRSGAVEVCRQKRAIGYKVDGALAEFLTLPATSLHRVPDSLSFEHAALAEPLACVVKAVGERSGVERGDFVVVLGCGPIGLLAAAVAKADGARTVLITGMSRDEGVRLPAARATGVDHVVNVEKTNVVEMVRDLTGGDGADLVVEASGAGPAIAQGFELVRTDGRIAAIGLCGRETITFPWNRIVTKAARVTGSYSSSVSSWDKAVALLATGQVNAPALISGRYPLRHWEQAFATLERQDAIKVLLEP
jgi:L-iditol 2-dehydrogenase